MMSKSFGQSSAQDQLRQILQPKLGPSSSTSRRATPDGKTALMMAAMFNRAEIVELLLARGADPRRADMNGVTALTAAQSMGAQDTPELLTEALAGRN